MFSDIDYSAFRGARQRPGLEDLKLRRHEFSAVIVPKLSRFGRSVKDLVGLFDLFDRDGIALHFLDMNLDTSTSQGRLLRHIMAAFAEYESDVKSDYAKATQRLMAREGRPAGSPPYGYRWIGTHSTRTFEIDEPAASVVRGIFAGSLAGRSVTALARDLNARGLVGPRGGEWSRQRVKAILDNPSYAAFRRHGGEEFPGRWPPLVTRRDFDGVRRARHARRSSYNDPPGRRNHLLSGLLVCEICARNLHHATYGAGRPVYRCGTGVSKPPKCLGGVITAGRAERLVTQAFFDCVGAAHSTKEFRRRWVEAGIQGRRAILGEVITKVVLLARPEGNRYGRGVPNGRSLRIEWSERWSERAFGYIGATSTLTPRDSRITSPQGKSWLEWRKQRLLPK